MQIAKYNASGNDFVIFHTFTEVDRSALAKKLCDRQKGIGADGLIVLLPHDIHDFKWQFYNSDGSTASMCGNGTRACAHYAFTHGLASASMDFLTGAGVIHSCVEGMSVETELTSAYECAKPFEKKGHMWYFYNTGVPHLVTFVKEDVPFDLELAREMRHQFNANINYVRVTKEGLHVRTYERGVEAETLACGTGMAASFYVANLLGLVNACVNVYPTSGEELQLRIVEGKLFFKGCVQHVFSAPWMLL